MNYWKITLLALMIAIVLTGCANTEEILPSGVYIEESQLSRQKGALVVDRTNSRVIYLKDGMNEKPLIGQLSLCDNRVICVFDEQGTEISFFALNGKALQYQRSNTGRSYDLQMRRDTVSTPVFKYSWVETVKIKWKDMVCKCKNGILAGYSTGN